MKGWRWEEMRASSGWIHLHRWVWRGPLSCGSFGGKRQQNIWQITITSTPIDLLLAPKIDHLDFTHTSIRTTQILNHTTKSTTPNKTFIATKCLHRPSSSPEEMEQNSFSSASHCVGLSPLLVVALLQD